MSQTSTYWRSALLGGLLLAVAGAPRAASAQQVLWADASRAGLADNREVAALSQYRAVTVQLPAMRAALATAPAEAGAGARNSTTVVSLPLPDGTAQRFRVVQVPVLHPQLAARYPQIRTYEAQGVDDPTATARLDVTPAGFHAMIMSSRGTTFIDPASAGSSTHLVFGRAAMDTRKVGFTCEVQDNLSAGFVLAPPTGPAPAQIANGSTLRTYRLALACTGEYAATKGGTVAGAMAGMATSINRVSGVYENEVAVRLVIIPRNDTLIFLNANTDPYTNNSGSTMLNENQRTVDARIGNANYDIGHVFSTGGGGIAQKPSVCINSGKARGVTGLGNPVGDAFDIDFVAHEIGHQFGGDHTFNSNTGNCAGGNRAANSAYEPGSGVTIMAYAGICAPQDLEQHSIPYFHSRSFDQIVAHITGAGSCGVNTPTGNTPPVVNAGANYRIPISTPFTLTGSATDANNDPLVYMWEQFDLDGSSTGSNPATPTGNAPLFRDFEPTAAPVRTFPRLTELLNNSTRIGEVLPSYARNIVFRLIARDNRTGGGGVDYDSMRVNVVGTAGPFLVQLPNTGSVSWQAGAPQQVMWDVANTTAAPINAANVDILLSTDGGQTYPTTLLANTPNDGYEIVTVPTSVAASTQARLKVQASGNIFFDISNQNYAITNGGAATFFLAPAVPQLPTVCPGQTLSLNVAVGQLQGFTGTVALSSNSLPTGLSVTYSNASPAVGATVQATIAATAATAPGLYTIALTGTSGGTTQSQQLTLRVLPYATAAAVAVSPIGGNPAGPRPRLTWQAVPNATSYEVQLASDANFSNVLQTQTGLTTTSYVVPTTLTAGTTYYWRVRGTSPCGTAPYSTANSFQVAATLNCTTYTSTQTVNIPFGATPTVTSTLNVTSSERVADIRIRNLAITHPDVSELTISLTNPAGRTVVLLANVCPGNANLSLSLNEAAASAITCPLTSGATYRPANSLAALLNDVASGTWTLTIADNNPSNGGQLTGWGLELCTLAEPPMAPTGLSAISGGVSNGVANVLLLWVDNSNDETGFQIERAAVNTTNYSLVATVAPNTTFTTDQFSGANGNYCYRVRAINPIGASAYTNESCVNFTTLGNQNAALLRGVEVYPNPSTGQFRVNIDNTQRGNVTLRVTDAVGRTISQVSLNKGAAALQHSFDLSKLSAGVYHLHLDMPDGTAVVKLMKQ